MPQEQHDRLVELIRKQAPQAVFDTAPMLRGRIVKVAGVPAEKVKPADEARWVLSGDRGLTYAEELPDGSRLVAGEWWPKNYDGPPLVSFEDEIAHGLGLKIGDIVTVNVLGDPDNGQIFAGYLGSLFLAGAYLAITGMTSALTRNQVIAFILSVVLCLFLLLAGFSPVTDLLVRWASPAFVDTVAAFSVVTHFDGFQKGVIDTRDLFYFLSVIGFSLFATGVVLRNR